LWKGSQLFWRYFWALLCLNNPARCHTVNIKLVLGWYFGTRITNLHDPYVQYCCTVWYAQSSVSQSINNFSLTCGQQQYLLPNSAYSYLANYLLCSTNIWCISLTQYPQWNLSAIVSGANKFMSQSWAYYSFWHILIKLLFTLLVDYFLNSYLNTTAYCLLRVSCFNYYCIILTPPTQYLCLEDVEIYQLYNYNTKYVMTSWDSILIVIIIIIGWMDCPACCMF